MTHDFWMFPTPPDSTIALRTDSGIVATLAPTPHPSGRTDGQLFTVPDGQVSGWGANLEISHADKVTESWRGKLRLFDDDGLAEFSIDTITLKDADSFKPAARTFTGNMCGCRVPGVRALTGAADPTTILSWAYDHYNADEQQLIRNAWQSKGLTDVLLSWPDSRGMGFSAQQFGGTVRTLRKQGFTPCVMLLSKDFDRASTMAAPSSMGRGGAVRLSRMRDWLDPKRPTPGPLSTGDGGRLALDELPRLQAQIAPVLPYLQKNAPRMCVAWEASLWLMPDLHQALIDWLAPQVTPWGCRVYMHLQQGYPVWQGYGPNGEELPFSAGWNPNVGKLTGLLYQKMLDDDDATFQSRIFDVLERFAGHFGCAGDSGFGHPFDIVALELNAERQYQGRDDEAEGDRLGRVAMAVPTVESAVGFGPVCVMGSGNGTV